MKQSFRFANIGIAAGSVIIFGGAFIFRHSGEGALQVVAILGFIAAFVVYHALEERARRRERKRPQ